MADINLIPITAKRFARYDRTLNWFFVYFLVLFMFIAFLYMDVVGAMVGIVFFYGIPLAFFLVGYAALLFFSIYHWLKFNEPVEWDRALYILVKLAFATMPMFYMDDRMARLFSFVKKALGQ